MRKSWRRGPARKPSPPPADAADAAGPAAMADALVAEAVRSLSLGDGAAFHRLAADLAGRPGTPHWTRTADRRIAARLRQGVTTAWNRGWQPADIVRFASRRRTSRHARLATDAIAGELRTYSPTTVDGQWHEQLAALDATIWWTDDDSHPAEWCHHEHVDRAVYITTALELAHLLETLPKLPLLAPPPGTLNSSGATPGSSETRPSGPDSSNASRADPGSPNPGPSGSGPSSPGPSSPGPSSPGSSGSRSSHRGGSRQGRSDAGSAGPGSAGAGASAAGRSGARTARESTRDVDQRVLGKVRALLAKAESTEFPEEAEALSARAQELMARHSIDQALLAAETDDMGGPAGRRIPVDKPYDAPKAVLLTVVADANRCRAVWHRDLGFCTVVGFPADLGGVEVLFTSLLVQATSAMVYAGPRRDARGRSRTRSFRHAFLNAYAARIGERLRGAADEAADRAAADAGGKDLLPVLAARDQAVEEVVGTMFPNLAKGRAGSVSNHEGWVAGRTAADLASLNGRSEVTGAFRGS
ncbi:DUF2786 domain-containing protein [Actinomadura monticuli]|uniref:DUF2786 domain-containing protein n=1 Tax=Actinomadura monticuli TaxID=3097367 RepID=A0ABV4QN31_9ACTN